VWWCDRLYDWLVASLWSVILAVFVYSAASRVVVTGQGLMLRWGGQILRLSFAAGLGVSALLFLIAWGFHWAGQQQAMSIGRTSLRIVLLNSLKWLARISHMMK
jgi:hypothetical protein